MEHDQRAKILVVDDLPENLVVYRAILEELGQDLVMVQSGEEALKEVLRHDFAVILLDVNMSGLNGLETAALLRTRKKSQHTPIIFLTAYTDEIRAAEGYAHGAVDFISTPVVPAVLRAKVKVFADLFHLNAQIRRHAEERVAHAQERSKREAAEEANHRLIFLARAGAIVTKSLDRDVTVENILRLVVPEHADQAVLAERDAAGRWRGMWARRFEPTITLTVEQGLADLPQSWRSAIEQAAAAQQSDGISPQAYDDGRDSGEFLALPFQERNEVFAVLFIVRGPLYSLCNQADLAMFSALAWRSAIGMVNARLYGEIEEADRQKNRFLSMLAHELRNPLAPIRSAVDVLQLCGHKPEEIGWARDVIDRQVSHMVRLVDDLLDISRVTLGKIRLKLEALDAKELITAAVEISRPLIEKHSHQLTLSIPDESVQVLGDRARLTQVLANLLNNAAKYTPPGGAISLSIAQEGETAVFRVRDNGIGIPPNMLDRVFDMFIQVENSLDRAHGGLGIGLTLVRELVHMHQGGISVTSDGPDRGSEFVVRIPCAIEPIVAEADAADGPAAVRA